MLHGFETSRPQDVYNTPTSSCRLTNLRKVFLKPMSSDDHDGINVDIPNSRSLAELYASLPVSHGAIPSSIRLLNLWTPREPRHQHDGETSIQSLHATLRLVNLDDHPTYATLSYVWGGRPDASYVLEVNGIQMHLTTNCHTALFSLVRKHGQITLWVDAVCIDQSNEVEKLEQIALMGGDLHLVCHNLCLARGWHQRYRDH